MQDDQGIDDVQFLAAGQEPLMKVEIQIGADNWINLNSMARIDLPLQAVFLDEFCGDSLDDAWTTHGLDADKTITLDNTPPCGVTISILNNVNGQWWCSVAANNLCPKMYMPLNIIGPCRITTKLLDYTVNIDTGAGIFIGTNPETPGVIGTNYVYLFGRRFITAGLAYKFQVQTNCSSFSSDQPPGAVPWLPMWLRIEIDASQDIRFKFSQDGITYHPYLERGEGGSGDELIINGYDIPNCYVGLYVKNTLSGGYRNIAAPFEFFQIDGPVRENYVEGASISLGGASMTPNPVAGKWNATLFNEDGIFHPQHPTSIYKEWLETERLVRISFGATYSDADYYWQRIIGYMDVPKFNASDMTVTISGGDYMKRLRDRELRLPDDNYWGDSWATTTLASDGMEGVELYTEGDAMDIAADAASIGPNWATIGGCALNWVAPGAAPSTNVGSVTNITSNTDGIRNTNVFTPAAADVQYKVTFQHRNVDREGARLRVRIDQTAGRCTYADFWPTNDWTEGIFYFTTRDNSNVQITFRLNPGFTEFQLDKISFYRFISYENRYYDLQDYDGAQKGPYHVTIDKGLGDGPEPVWQGEGDEGWWYEEATGHVFFDINKKVDPGLDMVIYYFKTEVGLENVVADLLVKAGIADALDFVATGVDVDKVWFEPGTNCLDAIKKICERCNYRFYFEWDGTPIFKPQATVGVTQIKFDDPKYLTSVFTYQDRNEIRNRIVIKGMRQAEPVNREQTMPPELEGELSHAGSIADYGERTLTINNHLFQTQDSILNAAEDDGMCFDLLAEYKDPKWYSDLKLDFHPAPLMLGDTIEWKERLSSTVKIDQKGIIRDIKISNFKTTYKCVLVL